MRGKYFVHNCDSASGSDSLVFIGAFAGHVELVTGYAALSPKVIAASAGASQS